MVNEHFPMRMINSLTPFPVSGPCYSFIQDKRTSRKTVWVVPHVIKHLEGTQIITWRCNWGNVCESECIYAMIKKNNLTRSILFSYDAENKCDPNIVTRSALR